MRNMSWAERHVIESADLKAEDASDGIIELAAQCLEDCYYIDRAAERLIDILSGRTLP